MPMTYEEMRAEAEDCDREQERERVSTERFFVEHPGWCKHCFGEGYLRDYSVGMDYECPECLGVEKCPKCGTVLTWDEAKEWYSPCATCGHECK